MPYTPDRLPRWLVRTGVVLTALLCLGMAGYLGQTWRARRLATLWAETYSHVAPQGMRQANASSWLYDWNNTPWYGKWGGAPLLIDIGDDTPHQFIMYTGKRRWIPRRTYYELLMLVTGQDLGNDPSPWESWFKAHPNLVWNEKLKRLAPADQTP